MVFVLSYPINLINSSKTNCLKKWREGNPSTFFYMEFKTLLFPKQEIKMMAWSTNSINATVQMYLSWTLRKYPGLVIGFNREN